MRVCWPCGRSGRNRGGNGPTAASGGWRRNSTACDGSADWKLSRSKTDGCVLPPEARNTCFRVAPCAKPRKKEPAMSHPDFAGIVSPILTPFDTQGGIAHDLYTAHAIWSRDAGAHYISPFGTTGEAVACGIEERKDVLERLVQAGIDPARMMPGN